MAIGVSIINSLILLVFATVSMKHVLSAGNIGSMMTDDNRADDIGGPFV